MALSKYEKRILNQVYTYIFNNKEALIIDNKVNLKPIYDDLREFCEKVRLEMPTTAEQVYLFTPCIETYCFMRGYIKVDLENAEGKENGKE